MSVSQSLLVVMYPAFRANQIKSRLSMSLAIQKALLTHQLYHDSPYVTPSCKLCTSWEQEYYYDSIVHGSYL